PELFWGLVASMYIGNVALLVLNLPLVGLFVRVLDVPRWILVPGVAALSYTSVYAVTGSGFDLVILTVLGVVGWAMRKGGFPLAPVILALVLGPLLEKNLRRSLALSGGEWGVLVSSPIAVGLWIAAAAALALPPLAARLRRRVGADG
ncbi:MAG: tripartite tricarboxylate transporter permease, partial [Longimicrobiales bacterium]